MSAVSDKARDFWDRISPRERRLVLIAAIAAPITIAIWLGLSIRDGLVDMETRNEKTRKALRVLDGMRADGLPQQKGDDVVAMMGTEPLSLPTYLDTAAKAAGFTLKTTSPHPSQTRNGFVTNSVSVTLEDLSIDQLKTFLSTVETNSKVVMVTHIDLRRDFRDKAKLDVNLEVSTYSKEPPPKGDGAGSGSAAKKGS
ncbi:MAG TPA: type II secretion system protein GspM [Kofleriaceae bacterium]|nr:type II secretion system protein GspM [Kofleriaceae bacterium]